MTFPIRRVAIERLPIKRLATSTVALALTVAGLASAARADTELSASASSMRNAIVALSIADAALPYATAISVARDDRVASVASLPALKPETSVAMASMRPTAARGSSAGLDRRARPPRDPFLLMLGVAY